MAKIYQLPTQLTGSVGVYPTQKFALFGDDLSTVTTSGYLNYSNLEGMALSTADVLPAFYNWDPYNLSGDFAIFSVNIAGNVITLAQTGGGGSGSGTVSSGLAKQMAYYSSNGTVVGGLATANSGVLSTNSSGTPSISTTLPSGLAMGTPASLTLTNATGLPLSSTTGTLSVSKGGTGVTTTPTNGQLLIGGSTGYTSSTLTAGTNVTITNADGAITIAASGGSGSGTVNAGTVNQLGVYSSSGTAISGLATANSGVLSTSSIGVPSISTTLPSGLALQTPASVTLTNATGLPLSAGTTGTLPVNRGGTGITTTPSNGQLLIGGSTGYTTGNLTAGSNVTITNSDGAITIASSGGSVAIDNSTLISSYYENNINFNTTAFNQKQVTPFYDISGTSYFVIAGRPNLLIYSFNGTSTTLVQTIYAGSNGYIFYGVEQYVISGVNYLAVILRRNTGPNSSILQVYTWTGSNYAQVGSDILYTASGFSDMTYFVITDVSYVAITDSANNRVLLFSWDAGASVYVLVSSIATQSVSSADYVVYYRIGSTNYITVSDAFKGISTYSWNGSTFVQISAQTIADAQFTNLSFFNVGFNYYLAGTTSNYIKIFQWDGTSSYTAIQTISNAGQYGFSLTTFTLNSSVYMSLTRKISNSYYVETYLWNSTSFNFLESKLLSSNVGLGIQKSTYNSNNYLLITSASGLFYIYQFVTSPVVQIGLCPTSTGGTGLIALPTNGQLLIGNGTGYTLNTLSAGTNIALTNASGAITINATTVISSDSGTATGQTITINGGSTGLTTAVTGTTISLTGTLGIANGGTGVATIPTNGQFLIGNGFDYTLANLTAGVGTSVINAAGSITINSTANTITWINQNTSTASMTAGNGYITNNAANLVTYTLPAIAALGAVISIAGQSSGKWLIAQNDGQNIIYNGVSTTTGTGGTLAAAGQYDSVQLVCIVENTRFLVLSSVGSLILV